MAWRQTAIILTNDWVLLIGPLVATFGKILSFNVLKAQVNIHITLAGYEEDLRLYGIIGYLRSTYIMMHNIPINVFCTVRNRASKPHISSHHDDVIMCAIAAQVTGVTIVFSTVCSGANRRKHQSSASQAVAGEFPA